MASRTVHRVDDQEFYQLLDKDGIADDIHLFNQRLREWDVRGRVVAAPSVLGTFIRTSISITQLKPSSSHAFSVAGF